MRHLLFDPQHGDDRVRWKICYQGLTLGPHTLRREDLRPFGDLVAACRRVSVRDPAQPIAPGDDETVPLYILPPGQKKKATVVVEDQQYEILKRAVIASIPLYGKGWALAVADTLDWLDRLPPTDPDGVTKGAELLPDLERRPRGRPRRS